jgi:hypothetical protein
MASKKSPKKPTMAQAFNAAQGAAVNRPKSSGPISYPEGASTRAKKAQSSRMTAQAVSSISKKMKTNSASSRRLQGQVDKAVKARAAKTDAARKKPVAGFETDKVRGADKAGSLTIIRDMFMPGGKNRLAYDEKAQRSPYTYKYKGAGSQASKKKK